MRNKKSLKKIFLNENLDFEMDIMEDDEFQFSKQERHSATDAVRQFSSYGDNIYRNAELKDIVEKIGNLVTIAEKLTYQETEEWFDDVTVSRHMKELRKTYELFEKTAKEVITYQQRLELAYEDMAIILNKYYEI